MAGEYLNHTLFYLLILSLKSSKELTYEWYYDRDSWTLAVGHQGTATSLTGRIQRCRGESDTW